ncbi:unnamed protein product [Mycena citricolor]|uniref:Uncharacterized protein n=1 Tax=Mycena citricolor TaxID=2018698 RepID=A0AAD2Q0D7_9AGAR|nr:unnamed protein product [Mycena citricolor]
MSARSPLSVVFLLHIALEIPLAIQGVWSPASLPFLQMNNTTLVVVKLYSALVFATCGVSLLCFGLPEFLPGKRALAIGLCIYHTICSTILYQAPRFIPMSLGAFAERLVSPMVDGRASFLFFRSFTRRQLQSHARRRLGNPTWSPRTSHGRLVARDPSLRSDDTPPMIRSSFVQEEQGYGETRSVRVCKNDSAAYLYCSEYTTT